jgi:hypothetical protein
MVDISDDAPLRLKDAVKIAFPSGGMTVSGLRREHANGRLEVEVIAGKQFVTLRAIRDMRERCKQTAPTYGKLSPRRDGTPLPPTVFPSDVLEARIRMRREKFRKEKREQKRRESYRVLRYD